MSCTFTEEKKIFLTISGVTKGSFWWKRSLSRTLLGSILIDTYYSHGPNLHLLSVCYARVSILGAFKHIFLRRKSVLLSYLWIPWEYTENLVYICLYLLVGKGSWASRNMNRNREGWKRVWFWTLRIVHIGGCGRWKWRNCWEQRSCERLGKLGALKRGELEVVRSSLCRIWLTDCPPAQNVWI